MLADALPLMIWVHDADGRQEFANQRFQEFFGTDGDGTRGDGWKNLMHAADAESYAREFECCVRERRFFNGTVRVRRHDGEWRWLESWARPRRTPSGEFLGFVGASADVHDLKSAGDSLRRADAEKNAFLATVAHELRNPLGTLRNVGELVSHSAAGDPVLSRCSEVLHDQLALMTRLVDDLLDLSRLGQSKLRLRRRAVDLGELLEATADSCRPRVATRRQDLSLVLPEAPLTIHADRSRLTQVFVNLLNNASSYTHPGGRLAVSLETGGDGAVVRVSDTGRGLAPEQLEEIFEPFVQVREGRRAGGGGLGLGLALVRQLVALHGGTVHAESDGPDQGSTFVVRLPLGDPTGP